MKKILYIFLLCAVALGMASCEGDKFGPSIFIDPVEDEDVCTRERNKLKNKKKSK